MNLASYAIGNTLCAIWNDRGDGSGHSHIRLAKSSDGAQHWTTSFVTSGTNDEAQPSISGDASGLHILYYVISPVADGTRARRLRLQRGGWLIRLAQPEARGPLHNEAVPPALHTAAVMLCRFIRLLSRSGGRHTHCATAWRREGGPVWRTL